MQGLQAQVRELIDILFSRGLTQQLGGSPCCYIGTSDGTPLDILLRGGDLRC